MDFQFKGIDGRIYHLAPITQGDQRTLKQWVRFREYFDFERLRDRLPADVFETKSRELLDKCVTREVTQDEVSNALFDHEGIVQMVYLSVKKTDATVTEDQIYNAISGENLVEVAEKVIAASGWNTLSATIEDRKKRAVRENQPEPLLVEVPTR